MQNANRRTIVGSKQTKVLKIVQSLYSSLRRLRLGCALGTPTEAPTIAPTSTPTALPTTPPTIFPSVSPSVLPTRELTLV